MTAEARVIDHQREVSPWRAVGLFVLLTALMRMPGVAAILTCRILGRPLRTLGLGTWNGRYVLIGYLVPIAYCLVASLGIWIFGFGGFPNTDFVRATAEGFGLGGASSCRGLLAQACGVANASLWITSARPPANLSA